MEYNRALKIAEAVKEQLAPFCHRIEIAGSIRRKKPEVNDIEIVAIPLPYNTGLFESGVASIINQWQKVKGELPCKYTQRMLPDGIKLDVFFAERDNWGLIYAIRTGSADFSHNVLAKRWVRMGYHSIDGYLNHKGVRIYVREEAELFERLGLKWVEPEERV
jgi:DNA polymerase/3'-5' exonuclease PolX